MYALVFLLLLLLGCGDSGPGDDIGGRPPLSSCTTDLDCPLGLRCESAACVDETGREPERPVPLSFQKPVAVGGRLLILSTEGNSVAILDPASRSVRSVAVPVEPVDLVAVPGRNAALILSKAARTLTLLDLGGPSLQRQHLGRAFDKVSVSADGSRALLWTPDGVLSPDGVEGLFALVDLGGLTSGQPVPVIEKVVGRRHATVFFRGGSDVVVVAQSEVGIFEVEGFGSEEERGVRLPLPATHGEPSTRAIEATPDGSVVLIRSLVSPDLLVVDVPTRTLRPLALPGRPSGLALSSDGSRAVAVLRDVGEVVWFDVPSSPSAEVALHTAAVSLPERQCETCLHPPGSVSLSADGRWAALVSTVDHVDAFATLDLDSGEWQTLAHLRKWVGRVDLAPDGRAAVVVHRSEPNPTVADPYEREVRRSEGYTIVDLETGTAQLQLTGVLVPGEAIFSPGGRRVGLSLSGEGGFRVDAIDPAGLLSTPHPLPSRIEALGPLEGETIWISQSHPLGRISFLELVGGTMQTITGFALQGEVR